MDYETYKYKIERRNRIRTRIVITFVLLTFLTLFIPFLFPDMQSLFFLSLAAILVIAPISVIIAIGYPILRPLTPPRITDGVIVEPEAPTQDTYFEVVKNNVLYLFTIPFFLILAITGLILFFQGFVTDGLIMIGTSFFFVLILILFDRLVIESTEDEIKIKFGPLKTRLKLDEISTIRPVAINWWKDYLGFGQRVASDGTIGIITTLKTGVRIEMKNGKTYEVSSNRSQELTNFVRYYKSELDKESEQTQ